MSGRHIVDSFILVALSVDTKYLELRYRYVYEKKSIKNAALSFLVRHANDATNTPLLVKQLQDTYAVLTLRNF